MSYKSGCRRRRTNDNNNKNNKRIVTGETCAIEVDSSPFAAPPFYMRKPTGLPACLPAHPLLSFSFP